MLQENTDYKIVEATPNDAQGILDFLKIVGGETGNLSFDGEGIGVTLEEEQEILQNYQNKKDGAYLLAKIGEEIIACANSSRFLNNKKQQHVFKMGICVKKKYWGNKIAQNMLEKLLEMSQIRGCKKMILYVNTTNSSAIKLYKKYGFEIEGKLKDNIFSQGKYLDDYLMSKILY